MIVKQLSIKNESVNDLVDRLVNMTGKGKTAVVLRALEHYEREVLAKHSGESVVDAIERIMSSSLKPEYRGKAPTKEEVEQELGLF